MKKLLRYWVFGILCLMTFPALAAAPSNLAFVQNMRTATRDWKEQLPDLHSAADAVAVKLIAGGHVYVAATQKSFQVEGLGRAGGLMLIKALNDKVVLTAQDTILAALDNTTDPADWDALVQRANEAGAKVLLFADPSLQKIHSSSLKDVQTFPTRHFANLPYASSPGTETVSNVIGMWSWMAELVTCCVQRGHVPTMFTSNAMPGGVERNAQFRKSTFHTTTDVTAKSVKELSEDYLEELDDALKDMAQTQGNAFARGAKMLRDAAADNHQVYVAYMGHMFPYELRWPGAPNWQIAAKTQIDATVPENLKTGDVFFFIDYQYFPWNLTSALQAKGIKSVITSSMKPLDHWATDADIAYINPFWKVRDAAVKLPGYDIHILPTSGILQSTIYWQLVQISK